MKSVESGRINVLFVTDEDDITKAQMWTLKDSFKNLKPEIEITKYCISDICDKDLLPMKSECKHLLFFISSERKVHFIPMWMAQVKVKKATLVVQSIADIEQSTTIVRKNENVDMQTTLLDVGSVQQNGGQTKSTADKNCNSEIELVLKNGNGDNKIRVLTISSWTNISSWWPEVLHVLLSTSKKKTADFRFEYIHGKTIVTEETLSTLVKVLSIFGGMEKSDSTNKVDVLNVSESETTKENSQNKDTSKPDSLHINVHKSRNNTDILNNILCILIGLGLIDKRNNLIRTQRSKNIDKTVMNFVYSFLFFVTALLNLPLVPVGCAMVVPFGLLIGSKSSTGCRKRLLVLMAVICIMFAVFAILDLHNGRLVFIALLIDTILWPTIAQFVLCHKMSYSYGTFSIMAKYWDTINFGFLGKLREYMMLRKPVRLIFKCIITVLSIPLIFVYIALFMCMPALMFNLIVANGCYSNAINQVFSKRFFLPFSIFLNSSFAAASFFFGYYGPLFIELSSVVYYIWLVIFCVFLSSLYTFYTILNFYSWHNLGLDWGIFSFFDD